MQDKELLNITVVTDDSTGMYEIGELNFGRTQFCMEWLKADPVNRVELTKFFLWLAKACSRSQPPFGDQPIPISEENAGDARKSVGYEERAKCPR